MGFHFATLSGVAAAGEAEEWAVSRMAEAAQRHSDWSAPSLTAHGDSPVRTEYKWTFGQRRFINNTNMSNGDPRNVLTSFPVRGWVAPPYMPCNRHDIIPTILSMSEPNPEAVFS